MNRIIKFRVWDGNMMYYPSYDLQTSNCDSMGSACISQGLKDCSYIESDVEIQQFTGLLDKNDREVYEGDIINFHIYGFPHEKYPENVTNAEVWFNEKEAMFVFGRYKTSDNYDFWYSMADTIDRESIEIVGNIFENENLLDSKN